MSKNSPISLQEQLSFEKWKDMSEEQLKEVATDLMKSHRGALLIGKALREAVLQYDKLPEERKPHSDMADIELLGLSYFGLGWMVSIMEDAQNEAMTQFQQEK